MKNQNYFVKQVQAGYHHSIFLTEDGRIYGFGRNHVGQLGDGSIHDFSEPVAAIFESNFVKISSGAFHNLAMKENHHLYGFGYDYVIIFIIFNSILISTENLVFKMVFLGIFQFLYSMKQHQLLIFQHNGYIL